MIERVNFILPFFIVVVMIMSMSMLSMIIMIKGCCRKILLEEIQEGFNHFIRKGWMERREDLEQYFLIRKVYYVN